MQERSSKQSTHSQSWARRRRDYSKSSDIRTAHSRPDARLRTSFNRRAFRFDKQPITAEVCPRVSILMESQKRPERCEKPANFCQGTSSLFSASPNKLKVTIESLSGEILTRCGCKPNSRSSVASGSELMMNGEIFSDSKALQPREDPQ